MPAASPHTAAEWLDGIPPVATRYVKSNSWVFHAAITILTTDAAIQPLTAARTLLKLVEQEQPDLVILGKQAIDDDALLDGGAGALDDDFPVHHLLHGMTPIPADFADVDGIDEDVADGRGRPISACLCRGPERVQAADDFRDTETATGAVGQQLALSVEREDEPDDIGLRRDDFERKALVVRDFHAAVA